jgi:hypothetical protein
MKGLIQINDVIETKFFPGNFLYKLKQQLNLKKNNHET